MNADLLLKHFDRMSDAPDAVPRLRRFILDLAVRGKLVEQDPKDEPAAALVEQIQAHRANLLKTGELKKLEPVKTVDKDEIRIFSIIRGTSKADGKGALETQPERCKIFD